MAKVLVVDDEEGIRVLCRVNLELEGYDVIEAADGKQALDAARDLRPDLIFLDIMMPGLSGDEICRRLKSDPSTRGMYVVILTARGQEEDERRAMQMGADEFMTKPFSPRKLRAKLLAVLGEPSRA